MLLDGVKQYGAGNWKCILRSYSFHTKRTAVDLKDKYRNILRARERKNKQSSTTRICLSSKSNDVTSCCHQLPLLMEKDVLERDTAALEQRTTVCNRQTSSSPMTEPSSSKTEQANDSPQRNILTRTTILGRTWGDQQLMGRLRPLQFGVQNNSIGIEKKEEGSVEEVSVQAPSPMKLTRLLCSSDIEP